MASVAKKAKKYMICSVCRSTASKKDLFMCIRDNCEVFGELYCDRCGQIAHENMHHKFDTASKHVQPLSFELITSNIKKGNLAVSGTVGTYEEQKHGEIRQYFASSVGVTVVQGVFQIATHSFAGGVGAGVMLVSEIAYHSYRFYKGEITSWKEYAYHVAKGVTAAAASGLGSWGGIAAGAAIGTLVGGPVGAIIGGIVGGIIGGIIGVKCGRSAFEKVWSDDFIHDEQKQRTEMIKKSLFLFGIVDIDDINNEKIFNEKRIKKKYYELAKIYHPDKNGGSPESHAKFAEISAALGVLLALLENKNKKKVVKKVVGVQAITYQKGVRNLIQILKTQQLMFIVDIFNKWKKEYTIHAILQMSGEGMMNIMTEINGKQDFKYNICVSKQRKFVKVIKSWKSWDNDDDHKRVKIENDCKNDDDHKSVKIENECKNEDEAVVGEQDDKDFGMNELVQQLKSKKVYFIVDLCLRLDEDLTLDALIDLSKQDLIELVNDINTDILSADAKISVVKKNKFAKMVSEYKSQIRKSWIL
eukprot:529378_1